MVEGQQEARRWEAELNERWQLRADTHKILFSLIALANFLQCMTLNNPYTSFRLVRMPGKWNSKPTVCLHEQI